MKKIILLLIISLLSICLSGCKKDIYVDTLSEEMYSEIVSCRKNIFVEECEPRILYFFGGYNDAYVVFMDPNGNSHYSEVLTEKVADYEFKYTTSRTIEVYYKGEFYSLQKALDEEILTVENIKKIKENFDNRENIGYCEELKNQGLSKDAYDEIVEVYPYLAIDKFFGEYNGAKVVWYVELRPLTQTVEYKVVSKYVFDQHDYLGIRVIYKGVSYSLEDAYEQGILLDDDLWQVSYKYNGISPDEISTEEMWLTPQGRRNLIKKYYDEILSIKYPEIEFDFINVFGYDERPNVYDDFLYLHVYFGTSNITKAEEIAGLVFTYYGDVDEILYCNGKLYTLSDAYNQGIIDKETLESIYNDWFK